MSLTLLVQLWARPGCERLLVEYEDQVLALLPAHGGRVLQRVRSAESATNEDSSTGPFEAHVLEFASEAALDGYMADPQRVALSDLRDRSIARTELLRVDVVAP